MGAQMSTAIEIQPRAILGINLIRLRDGREFLVNDIATAEQGRLLLAEVDAAILGIEDQIEHADITTQNGRDWVKRAERALKVKRRSRPILQARIGELARAERGTAGRLAHEAQIRKADTKRRAFIQAAFELLGHEACTEIWTRAAELQPAAFLDGNLEGRP